MRLPRPLSSRRPRQPGGRTSTLGEGETGLYLRALQLRNVGDCQREIPTPAPRWTEGGGGAFEKVRGVNDMSRKLRIRAIASNRRRKRISDETSHRQEEVGPRGGAFRGRDSPCRDVQGTLDKSRVRGVLGDSSLRVIELECLRLTRMRREPPPARGQRRQRAPRSLASVSGSAANRAASHESSSTGVRSIESGPFPRSLAGVSKG